MSPSSAKQIGTTCGRPSRPTVARRATRESSGRGKAVSICRECRVTAMDAHVLVPLKRIDPKSRLAGELPLEERVRLMRGLLAGVVGAAREAGVERVTVVTGLTLKGYDVWDDRGLPWNDALAAAIE